MTTSTSERRYYATHEDEDRFEPVDGDTPEAAASAFAADAGLEVGDEVIVVYGTEADDVPGGYDAEDEGWPLVVETTWRFRIVAERADGFDFEEVPGG